MNIRFTGRVFPRSTKKTGLGPPGEVEVMRLNPHRKVKILDVTGWQILEAGTLNLRVRQDVVSGLERLVPDLQEDGAYIKYPEKYQHIPKFRKGYWYYKGVASSSHETEEILVRRAINATKILDRVELFAQVNLREKFQLIDDALLTVQVRARPKTVLHL